MRDDPDFNYSDLFKVNPIPLQSNQRMRLWDANRSNVVGYSIADYQTSLWIHFDWPGGNWREWENEYRWYRDDSYRNRMNRKPTIYSTIWCEQSEIAIQYWFFYPQDHFANNHEGDWEHINVIISSQLENKAQINSVVFYFHDYWHEWTAEDLQYTDWDKNHILVYVGGTPDIERLGNIKEHEIFYSYHEGHLSGASYPHAGKWKSIQKALLLTTNEEVRGAGPTLPWYQITDGSDEPCDNKGLELLKDPEYLGYVFFDYHPEYSWLKAKIGFGEPFNDPNPLYQDMSMCFGPYNHIAWRKIRGSSSYSHY